MARTFDSARLRHQRRMEQRLTAEHRNLARIIAGMVVRAGTVRTSTGTLIIPNSRRLRDTLKDAIWEQVLKPYYIGPNANPLSGAEPLSPYARLLVEGISEATRIQVQRQVAIVRRVVRDDVVLRWLTGPRPVLPVREQRGVYDPFHQWVDPNGYRLSDRIWRTSIEVRSRIDRLLDYHIARGTSAVDIAELLEPFLTPQALRQRTVRPYGTEGSYAARRLARTEITAAAGRATVNAAAANPFVERLQWRTSGSHPGFDICDQNARGGPNGDGIYAIAETPPYPSHPNCLCSLLPVPTGSTADLVQSLRADIDAARPRARRLQGILNPIFLVQAILLGFLDEALLLEATVPIEAVPV